MKRILPLVLTAGVVLVASDAGAFWICASGGFSSYSMSDVNTDIAGVNAAIYPYAMEKIDSGATFGFGVGAPVGPSVDLAIGYERLAASSAVGDATGRLEYNLPADVFKADLLYRFPSTGPFVWGLGGGVGFIRSAGNIALSATGAPAIRDDISGSAVLIEGMLTADCRLGPEVALTAAAGFRYASIGEIEVGGIPAFMTDGSCESVDYSGLLLRAGLKVSIPDTR